MEADLFPLYALDTKILSICFFLYDSVFISIIYFNIYFKLFLCRFLDLFWPLKNKSIFKKNILQSN